MNNSLSISNILQALYEESPTIKMYVDCIADGKPVPFTLITKSTEHEKNEQIVERLRDYLKMVQLGNMDGAGADNLEDKLLELLDEAMVLEEEKYEVHMELDGKIVSNTFQTVDGSRVVFLREYAKLKGYTISVKKA